MNLPKTIFYILFWDGAKMNSIQKIILFLGLMLILASIFIVPFKAQKVMQKTEIVSFGNRQTMADLNASQQMRGLDMNFVANYYYICDKY